MTFHKLFNTTEFHFYRFLWTSFSKTRSSWNFSIKIIQFQDVPSKERQHSCWIAEKFRCGAEKLMWNFRKSYWCLKASDVWRFRSSWNTKNLRIVLGPVHIRIVSLRKIKLNVIKRLHQLAKFSENESKQFFISKASEFSEGRKNILSIETWINKLPISDRTAHWKMIESKMGWREGVRTYIKWIWKRAGGVGEWKNKFDKACLNDERTRKGSHTTVRDKKGNFILLTDKSHPLRLTPSACRVNFKMAWFIDLIIKSHSGTQLWVDAGKAKEKGLHDSSRRSLFIRTN